MRFQNRPPWHAPRRTRDQRSAEETAAALVVALKWRQEWRAELAAGKAKVESWIETEAPERRAGKEDARRLEKFAEAVARAEFGRAYWDKRLNEAKQGWDNRPMRKPK